MSKPYWCKPRGACAARGSAHRRISARGPRPSRARRGKKIAMVAFARRLARMLFAMWRDETDYQPTRVRPRRPAADDEATSCAPPSTA